MPTCAKQNTIAEPSPIYNLILPIPERGLDGLYASQNVIRLVETKRWKYIISFKEGSMPERFAEAVSLAAMQTQNRLVTQQPNRVQNFSWAQQVTIAEFKPDILFTARIQHYSADPARQSDQVFVQDVRLCEECEEKGHI